MEVCDQKATVLVNPWPRLGSKSCGLQSDQEQGCVKEASWVFLLADVDTNVAAQQGKKTNGMWIMDIRECSLTLLSIS